MRQSDGTNNLDFQYDAGGTAVGFNYNDTPYFYVRNLLGDVVAVTDAGGTVIAEYAYDAWGNITAASGAMAAVNPIRYRGYYQDPTGLYYLQSRYYLPEWRRFLNADSLFVASDEINGSNMYAYCDGNPVMFADDGGMKPRRFVPQGLYDWAEKYNKKANKISQQASAWLGKKIMSPGAEVFRDEAIPAIGGVMDPIPNAFNIPIDQRKNPTNFYLRDIPGLNNNMQILAGPGALFLDFHKNWNIFDSNFGNYTTLEGNYQWQKDVGYNWWYDFFFSVGGQIGRVIFPFVGDNGTHYAVWCWKGEYWNLGAGAEIGIYYNTDAAAADQGYYLIDPDNLKISVLMNVTYKGKKITDNFAQTNWWITSFTPRKQNPDVSQLFVALKVSFVDIGTNSNLMKPFYTEGLYQKGLNRWPELNWGDTFNISGRHTTCYCGNHPTRCTCSCPYGTCGRPCRTYVDYQFNINY